MFTAASVYGATPATPLYQAPTTQVMAPSAWPSGVAGLLSPHNPVFWVGVVLAVTIGALGVAGSVRLGEARLSASVDRGK